MKLTTTVILGTMVAAALVIAAWVAVFHGPLSDNANDWSAFGGYFGGILSPLIAALALIAFLHTIKQQQVQIEQLKRQGTKEDLWRVIEKIEKDFEIALRRYPIKLHTSGQIYEYSGFDVAFDISFVDYQKVMINTDDVVKSIEGRETFPRDDPGILAIEMFGMAAGHINQLRIYVEKYAEVAGNNSMTKYFQRKYKIPFERFVERGYLKETWRTEI
jgi:uncharacterized membrane protein